MITIPNDYPVQPIASILDPTATRAMQCGTCGLAWDDAIVTSMTPVPSGRCPFEYFHEDDEYDECPIMVEVDGPPSGERIGTCTCGRPIYRSRMAGTIYHATEDGWTPRHVDDDGTIHPAAPKP